MEKPRFSCSLPCVRHATFTFHGPRHQEETRWYGVGFKLLHRTRHLGISQRRAEWFLK